MATYYLDDNGVLKKEEKKKKKSTTYVLGDDGTLTEESKESTGNGWVQAGALSDGFSLKNLGKTVLGTVTDLVEDAVTGIVGMGEKTVDAILTAAPYVAQGQYYQNGGAYQAPAQQAAFEASIQAGKEGNAEIVKKDMYDEKAIVESIISAPIKNSTGFDIEEASVFGDKVDALAQSGGQLLATAGLSALGVPWWLTSGATSFGAESENALNQDATLDEAAVSGLISAGAEILTEKISGGIKFGGNTLDDALTKQLSRAISNKTVRTLAKLGVDTVGEGAEEVLSGYLSAIGQKLTYADDKTIKELFSSEDAMEAFIGGAILGGVSGTAQAVKSTVSGSDYASGMTNNEKAVVDKVYQEAVKQEESNGKKLSQKEKSKIYDKALNDLEKGYISTDTIESVLGEKAAEFAKSDRLGESYNEKARKGQAFEADLTQYNEKQRAIVQKAVESGILNNTNRTHEFVDLIVKIAADKGVSFDFTNNQKLKESGFALEGKIVNGFVQGGNVSLNIDSAKALNTVVGHEITHVLEGTELYGVLQEAVKAYATKKGEYDTRLKAITELYNGVEGSNVEAELTADLVGDYLFTDSDFVNRLSTEQPDIFQKIFDEIKYLCRMATAGSKEARELERVKRAFEKAYKESTANVEDSSIKYSLAKDAASELHKALYDKKYDNEVLLRDETPAIMLAQSGVKNLPMAMNASHIRENVFTEEEAIKLGLRVDDHMHYHGLGEEFFLKIIDGLDNVELAYRGTKNAANPARREDYFLLISEFKDTDGNTVNVPVFINKHAKYNNVFIPTNKAATVFGRENIEDYIRRQVQEKNLVRIKNRSNNSSESPALIAGHYRETTSTDSIPHLSENATKKSLSSTFEDITPIGSNVYGKDIRLEQDAMDDIGPLPEESKTAPSTNETLSEEIGPLPETSEPSREIKTVKDRLTAKLQNVQTELANVQEHRETSRLGYEQKINEARAALEGKKNQNTKEANALRLRIERLQRQMANTDADYAKRISDIQKQMARLEEDLKKDHTKKDRLEKALRRIDNAYKFDRADMETEFVERRHEYSDKAGYIKEKASNLYDEIYGLKKGVRASADLGRILDLGYSWNEIKSTLASIKFSPSLTVNQDSALEGMIREMLDDNYSKKVDDLEAEYQQSVKKLDEDTEEKRKNARTANQRRITQKGYQEQMSELIGDTSTWKDKKMGISYKVNTLRRNLRDIVRKADGSRDIERADAIYDALQGTYNKNEASLNREANAIKDKFRKMKITPAEDKYIQMLGEYKDNPDTSLSADEIKEFYEANKSDIDTEKVDKIIEEARKLYDGLFERVNEVLRDQGMKEVPYRKGYFPHFIEEKQPLLARIMGWKVKNNEIPTDLAGLTEQFNPERSWQSFNKQRTGDETTYSFTKGLDSYVNGALDWIYHIPDIQKRRAFENEIRYRHSEQGVKDKIDALRNNEEYSAEELQEQIDLVYGEAKNPLNNFVTDFRTQTNTLAGKKSSMDRGMEEATNRKFYSVMTNLSNRATANMVAGSVSSALTNFIPITQSWGEVSPLSSLRAMGDTIRSTFRDDGTIDKSDFLTNRLKKNTNLNQTFWEKASEKAGILMEAVDSFTSQTVWRSKYLENISAGMSENAAIKNADQFAENVMAGRSRGNNPTIFDAKNPIVKMFTAFQLEVANQYGYMFKDMPQDMANKTKASLIKGYASMFLGAYAYNALYSSLTGRDAAFDPIGIIEDLLKDLGWLGDDEEEEPTEIITNFAENILEEVPYIGGLMGGGRVPISSAIPYDGNIMDMVEGVGKLVEGDTSELTEWLNPVYYLALPFGGGQIRKTVQGLSMFSDEHPIAGSYTNSGNLRFPVDDTVGSKIKAGIFGQWSSKNARDYFENSRKPLEEKQIEEFMDLDLPIADYWEYREGLAELSTMEEKFDYIAGLDVTDEQKNIMVNNIVDRKKPVDMSNYDEFADYEEFDWYVKNTEKYEFLQTNGISYSEYKSSDEKKKMYDGMYNMKKENPGKYLFLLANSVSFEEYYGNKERYDGEYNLRKNYPDKYEFLEELGVSYDEYDATEESREAYNWAYNNQGKYKVSQIIEEDVVKYREITSALNSIQADKDSKGNAVSGSAKRKKIEYINSLDMEYGQKLILYRMTFGTDDTYNKEILNYLNGRKDMKYNQKKEILNELGIKVNSDGSVSW